MVLVAAGLGNVITGPAPTNLNWLQIHKYMDTQSRPIPSMFIMKTQHIDVENISGMFVFFQLITDIDIELSP